jgi:hypothetical protein
MAVLSGALLAEFLKSFQRAPATQESNPTFNYALSVFIFILPLMLLPGIRESWWKDSPPPYHLATTPITATDWLGAHPDLPGPLFAEYTFGSYLTYALPSRLLWIDNRFNAYPPEHWKKYQTISSAQYPWERLLDQDKVNLLMLSLTTQKTLVDAVEDSNQWCEQYHDKTAVIFSRCNPIP